MGTGILVTIKSIAPLVLYVVGICFFLMALIGKPRWAFLLVVLLLPLRNIVDRLQAFPLGNQYIDILIIGMLIGWPLSALTQRIKLMEKSPLSITSIFLVIYTFISLQLGNEYLRTFSHFDVSDPRVQDWKNFCLLPLLYFLTFNIILDKKWVWRTFTVMCFSMAIMAYYTFNQISWYSALVSRVKINGTFQFLGPNEVAAFLNECSIILLSVWFFMKKGLNKTLLILLILANLYCLLFIYSRGGYIAFAVGLFFLFAFKKRVLLVPLLLAAIFWQIVLPEKAIERIQGTTNVYGELDLSTERRLEMWTAGMQIFQENPIVGVGFGVFRNLGFSLKDTHNIYVKILVEQGIVGLVVFLLVVLCFIYEGSRLYRKGDDDLSRGLGLGLAISIIVLLVNNIFGDRWSYLELSAYLWIYAGLASRLRVLPSQAYQEKISLQKNSKKIRKLKII